MFAVVTRGAPSRLKSARLVSRMRSRVRRGRFLSAIRTAVREPVLAGRREPALEMIERVREIARRLPHPALAPALDVERARIGQGVRDVAGWIRNAFGPQRHPMPRKLPRERCGPRGEIPPGLLV